MQENKNPKEILFTKEYDLFKMLKFNRDINKRQIDKIKTFLLEEGWDITQPLIADYETFEIIDGQHRFIAAKELGIEIPVLFKQNFLPEDLIKINNRQSKWKPEDYVKFWKNQGNYYYHALEDFYKRFKLPVSFSAALMSGKSHSGYLVEEIKEGRFKYDGKFCEAAKDTAYNINRFLDKLDKGIKSDRLLRALLKAFETKEFNVLVLIKKQTQYPMLIKKDTTTWGYLQQIETLYNYKEKKSNHLKLM